jgi:hypothetical protein
MLITVLCSAVQARLAEVLVPAPLLFPDEYPQLLDDCDPVRTLVDGKAMARSLAAALQDLPRLNLARSFCGSLIQTCWFEAQLKYKRAWALPDALFQVPPDDLDEPAASLARTMGRAAARLDPSLSTEALAQAIAGWQAGNLSASALARVEFMRRGVVATEYGVMVTFPNGETRKLAAGPSSIITKAVVEEFS